MVFRVWLPTKDAVIRAREADLAPLSNLQPTEQRIGRVDPIGQQHVVRATNFVLGETVEYRVRLEDSRARALIAELPHCVAGQPIPRVRVAGLPDTITSVWSLWEISLSADAFTCRSPLAGEHRWRHAVAVAVCRPQAGSYRSWCFS